MKYYLVVGEASGDLHAANLMKQLKLQDTEAEFRFWGGDLMQAAGGVNVSHFKERAFMGFWEVIKNLRKVTGFITQCKADIQQYQPDALILVDYPGFNLRIADFAKKHGIKVFYYISPQIWAWKESRVNIIKASVDHMFTILPFEEEFYKKHDYVIDFVGHPLLDAIEGIETDPDFITKHNLSDKPIIALLPGSRKQEIAKMLDIMLGMRKHFPTYQFVIAGAPSISIESYREIIPDEDVKVVENQTYQLLFHAEAALVTSGTATLETALFEVPEVVCYKGSRFSYLIAKKLIKVKYISLVNLIMDREVVKELIQDELNEENLKSELRKILIGGVKRRKMLDNFQELKVLLGNKGASEKTAKLILEYLNK